MGIPDARLEPYCCQYERFPEGIFGVKEEHPMMEVFDGDNSLAELISHL